MNDPLARPLLKVGQDAAASIFELLAMISRTCSIGILSSSEGPPARFFR